MSTKLKSFQEDGMRKLAINEKKLLEEQKLTNKKYAEAKRIQTEMQTKNKAFRNQLIKQISDFSGKLSKLNDLSAVKTLISKNTRRFDDIDENIKEFNSFAPQQQLHNTKCHYSM